MEQILGLDLVLRHLILMQEAWWGYDTSKAAQPVHGIHETKIQVVLTVKGLSLPCADLMSVPACPVLAFGTSQQTFLPWHWNQPCHVAHCDLAKLEAPPPPLSGLSVQHWRASVCWREDRHLQKQLSSQLPAVMQPDGLPSHGQL